MIDIENQIFTKIATKLRTEYRDISVLGSKAIVPASYPCVFIEQEDSTTVETTSDSGSFENHAEVTFLVDIYSQKEDLAKSEAKAISAIVNDEFLKYGFSRLMYMPIDTVTGVGYRISARYRAVVGTDERIYRR